MTRYDRVAIVYLFMAVMQFIILSDTERALLVLLSGALSCIFGSAGAIYMLKAQRHCDKENENDGIEM